MPRAIVDRLNTEIRAMWAEPKVAERLLSLGAEARPRPPEALSPLFTAETARLGMLVRDANVKLNKHP